ncbi:MAG TPA: tetratricopeptide repeat protein [Blastocatellia bacterium]|jgi:tetratricopeptide (TPR) repeat protein|nr:tetratricopeptide repeat protein [Blastocatellia bacterium]
MTMNYCGKCGSANGSTARFCRQCGADLSSQAAASSSSTPFSVEFSRKPVKKDPEKEAKPAPSETEAGAGAKPVEDAQGGRPAAAAPPDGADQDPKAISASLRRIRASGPLILEAIKQNDRESMERINEIIEQSIQGMGEEKKPVESSAKPLVDSVTPAEPPAAAPTQQLKPRESTQSMNSSVAGAATSGRTGASTGAANEEARPQPTLQISSGQSAGRQTGQAIVRATAQRGARAAVKPASQPDAQTSKQKAAVAMAQSLARRVTGWLSVSNANRSVTQVAHGGAHSGPSTVLMQASGFKPKSNIGPRVILGIVALAILLAFPIYFIFRDRLLTQARPADGDLNLISPADQGAQLVKAASLERAQGQYKAAIEHFHHAIELTPNNWDTRFLLARTYMEAGQIDEAAKNCKEIIRIRPYHLDARLQLATIYRAKGNWTAAHAQYRYIIEYDQSSAQAADALAAIESQQAVALMEERAAERAKRGRKRSAIPSLPVAVLPNTVPLLTSEFSEVRRVKPPEALSGIGIEEKPDPRGLAEVHKRRGVRYFNIREYNAALREFLEALNLTQDDKDLYYLIGSSYHGMGRLADAYDYYMRVNSGVYVGPAESGAKQTRKAAQEANKRHNNLQLPSIKNELEEINQNKSGKHKSVVNKILDTLR